MSTWTIRERITAAICQTLGHTHPGIDPTKGIPPEQCNQGLLADAALRVFNDPEVIDRLTMAITIELETMDQAWDAPEDQRDLDWHKEQAGAAVSMVLMHLGHGSPTMQGRRCPFEFPDGQTCIYGAHHTVRHHRPPTSDSKVPAGVPR